MTEITQADIDCLADAMEEFGFPENAEALRQGQHSGSALTLRAIAKARQQGREVFVRLCDDHITRLKNINAGLLPISTITNLMNEFLGDEERVFADNTYAETQSYQHGFALGRQWGREEAEAKRFGTATAILTDVKAQQAIKKAHDEIEAQAREAALREAAGVCDGVADGERDTILLHAACERYAARECRDAILALIDKEPK